MLKSFMNNIYLTKTKHMPVLVQHQERCMIHKGPVILLCKQYVYTSTTWCTSPTCDQYLNRSYLIWSYIHIEAHPDNYVCLVTLTLYSQNQCHLPLAPTTGNQANYNTAFKELYSPKIKVQKILLGQASKVSFLCFPLTTISTRLLR